jgi:hypothetical protein
MNLERVYKGGKKSQVPEKEEGALHLSHGGDNYKRRKLT